MLVQDQSKTIAFLREPAAYAGLGLKGPVERIETHISEVFLIGDRVFKLKRAVKFPYLDFSTEAKRKAAADAELRLNRRTAPDIYLGLAVVTRGADGGLELSLHEDGEDTDAIEWLVAMRRFPQEALLDAMAARGELPVAVMEDVAEAVAAFHDEARW